MVFQPFEDDFSLHDALDHMLNDERLTQLTVVVAWAKESGLKHIRPMLQAFRARGGTARILLGIDEGGATLEGLHAAINDFNEASVLFDAKSGTFHPKLYLASGKDISILIIGSNNLTKGGLFRNYEAGIYLELDLEEDADLQIHKAVTHYIKRLQDDGTSRPLTEQLIQQLPTCFLIGSEAYPATKKASGDSFGLSGSAKDAAQLFGTSHHKKKPTPPTHPANKSVKTPASATSGGVYASFGDVQPTVNNINEAIPWLIATMHGTPAFGPAMRKRKNPLASWAQAHYPGMNTKKPDKQQILDYLNQALIALQDTDADSS